MHGSDASPEAAVAVARPGRFTTFAERNWRHLFELAFIVPAYIAYQFVRSAVEGQAGAAFENATRIIRIEQRLGIFREAFLQQLILPKAWAVDFFNYVYIWGHLPVIIVVAVWLYISHRDRYPLFRNAFLISGFIALIGFSTVPLAPPRYMPEFGFTNTIINAQSYYVLQSPKIVNQYAAMPSLHFGWDLLVAIAVTSNASNPWVKRVAVFFPVLTLSGIVLTANHYFLDAVGGGLVAVTGLSIALLLRRTLPQRGILRFLL